MSDAQATLEAAFPLTRKVKRWLWRHGVIDARKNIRPEGGATRVTGVIAYWHEELAATYDNDRDKAVATLNSEAKSIPAKRTSVEKQIQNIQAIISQLQNAAPVAPDPHTRAVPGDTALKEALLLIKAKREWDERKAREQTRLAELQAQLTHLNVREQQIPAAMDAQDVLARDLKAISKAHSNRQIFYYGAVLARWHKSRRSAGVDLTLQGL